MRLSSLILSLLAISIAKADPSAPEARKVLGIDKGRAAIVDGSGKVEWEYPARGESHDVWLLPSGNVLMTIAPATVGYLGPSSAVLERTGRTGSSAFSGVASVGRLGATSAY